MINFKKSGQHSSTIKLDLSSQLKQHLESGEFGIHTLISLGIKLAVIGIIPAGLVFYEKYNKNMLLQQKAQVEGELNAKNQELQKLTSQLAAYDGAHKKHEDFQNKLGILKKIAQERIMVIRVLDSVQDAMGRASEQENMNDFMFFSTVSVKGDKLTIAGSASKEDVIDQFVGRLQRQDTVYHSINWEDVVSNQQTKIKNFRITGKIIDDSGT
ncbi:MAG: hypothetical protein OXK80_02205 [Bdellovibrionales bacterium]|nr:hypothetical protein [Bdellovibrionales bacterium]